MEMFKVVKGKLKEVNRYWHRYLLDRTLVLITGFNDTWTLGAIEGEEDLSGLCEFSWRYEEENGIEHDYFTLEDFIEDLQDGNGGFGFAKNEIVVTEEVIDYDLEGA